LISPHYVSTLIAFGINTYSEERQIVAKNLIDFDREWSNLMATPEEEFDDPAELEKFYVKTAEFPAGFMTEYQPSMITGENKYQHLAAGFPIGKRFHSAIAVRVSDATPLEIGHLARADGRWRIYVFADRDQSASKVWADWLANSAKSPVLAHTPEGKDADYLFDIKVIYQASHDKIEIPALPEAFKPVVGPFKLVNTEQIFAVDPSRDIFDARGIDRDQGAVVVVRPDQYVAHVLPLEATTELASFFAGFLR
jgi:phenol 2-monooxygenase